MDKLASSVFRKYFAKLDAPTIVTVNGHAIGTWVPGSDPQIQTAQVGDDWIQNRQTTEVSHQRINQATKELRMLVDQARSELDTLYWRNLSGNKTIESALLDALDRIHAVAAASVPPHDPEPH